jgi:hypothetical protein
VKHYFAAFTHLTQTRLHGLPPMLVYTSHSTLTTHHSTRHTCPQADTPHTTSTSTSTMGTTIHTSGSHWTTDDNERSANAISQTLSSASDTKKGELRWDFKFGGDDSPRSSLPPRKPDRSSMYTAKTYETLSSTPPSTPPSSVEKKHGAYCRIKTTVKKILRAKVGREREVKEDPRILVCCLCLVN